MCLQACILAGYFIKNKHKVYRYSAIKMQYYQKFIAPSLFKVVNGINPALNPDKRTKIKDFINSSDRPEAVF